MSRIVILASVHANAKSYLLLEDFGGEKGKYKELEDTCSSSLEAGRMTVRTMDKGIELDVGTKGTLELTPAAPTKSYRELVAEYRARQ